MFKRYSKNGGETSTFCHVAVLAREAERLSSLRLEYELDPKLEEGRTTSRRFSDRYHLVSLHPATSFVNCESRSLRHLIRSSVSLVSPVSLTISRREQVSPNYLGLRHHPLMLTREPGRTLLSEMTTRRTTGGLSFWSRLRQCWVGNRRIILFSSPAVKERNAGQNHQHSAG